MIRILISLFLFTSVIGIPYAQDVDPSRIDELKNQEAEAKNRENDLQEKRSKVSKEIANLSKDVKKISSDLTILEAKQAELVDELGELEVKRDKTSETISKRNVSITEFLAALQRIESNPPPVLATHPNDAAKASRAGLLLGNLTSQISDRVNALNLELAKFDQLQTEIYQKQVNLNRNQSEMTGRRTKLKNLVREKHALETTLNADYADTRARRLAIAAEAQSLQDLIEQLERKSKDIIPRIKPDPDMAAAEPSPDTNRTSVSSDPVIFSSGDLRFSSSKGKLFPVTQGELSKRYSSSHPGLSIATGDGGQVFAPASGRVEFAGPFKNYNQVIILNVGDGYYVLLTGLNRLLVQDDSRVSAGEPVGLMPVNSPNDEKLYIELRKNGSTIDPVPWFGTTFAKPNNG